MNREHFKEQNEVIKEYSITDEIVLLPGQFMEHTKTVVGDADSK